MLRLASKNAQYSVSKLCRTFSSLSAPTPQQIPSLFISRLQISLSLSDAEVQRLIARLPRLATSKEMNTAAPVMTFLQKRVILSTLELKGLILKFPR